MKVHHLFENAAIKIDAEKVADFLFNSNPDFFRKYNFKKRPLYRGVQRPLTKSVVFTADETTGTGVVVQSTTKRNRTPLNMPTKLHDAYNDEFERRFGIRARSDTIFCSSQSVAENYGTPCLIVPVSDFSMLASEVIKDLWDETSYNDRKHLPRLAKIDSGTDKKLRALFKVGKDEDLESVILQARSSKSEMEKITGLSMKEYYQELVKIIVPHYTDDIDDIATFDPHGEVMLKSDECFLVPIYTPEFSQYLLEALMKK